MEKNVINKRHLLNKFSINGKMKQNIKRTKWRRMDWRNKGSRKKLSTCTM